MQRFSMLMALMAISCPFVAVAAPATTTPCTTTTITRSTTRPTTVTTTPSSIRVSPPPATTASTTTTTTTIAQLTPTPSCNGKPISAGGITFCPFFSGYQMRNSFQFDTTDFYDDTPAGPISDDDAKQRCANHVAGLSGVAKTFQIFYVPMYKRWHCDSSKEMNCDSNFHTDTLPNQMYQYNAIGSCSA